MANNNWTPDDETPPEPFIEPYKAPLYEPMPREQRVVKHINRLKAADEMLADGQISQVERDAIRNRMLQVIENPNA